MNCCYFVCWVFVINVWRFWWKGLSKRRLFGRAEYSAHWVGRSCFKEARCMRQDGKSQMNEAIWSSCLDGEHWMITTTRSWLISSGICERNCDIDVQVWIVVFVHTDLALLNCDLVSHNPEFACLKFCCIVYLVSCVMWKLLNLVVIRSFKSNK